MEDMVQGSHAIGPWHVIGRRGRCGRVSMRSARFLSERWEGVEQAGVLGCDENERGRWEYDERLCRR
jgi:hypothetical protein